MWTDALKSVEGIIGSLALIITAIIGAYMTVRQAVKTKPAPAADVVQGQAVTQSAPVLSDNERALQERLMKALLRLADHDIPYDDI